MRQYHGLVRSALHENDHIILFHHLINEPLDTAIGIGAEEAPAG